MGFHDSLVPLVVCKVPTQEKGYDNGIVTVGSVCVCVCVGGGGGGGSAEGRGQRPSSMA